MKNSYNIVYSVESINYTKIHNFVIYANLWRAYQLIKNEYTISLIKYDNLKKYN